MDNIDRQVLNDDEYFTFLAVLHTIVARDVARLNDILTHPDLAGAARRGGDEARRDDGGTKRLAEEDDRDGHKKSHY